MKEIKGIFFCHMKLLGETTGEVKIVADMHQRKSEMAKQADAFIALPGHHHLNTLNTFISTYFFLLEIV